MQGILVRGKTGGTEAGDYGKINRMNGAGMGNVNDAVASKILVITRYIRKYFSDISNYEGEELNIVKEWDNSVR